MVTDRCLFNPIYFIENYCLINGKHIKLKDYQKKFINDIIKKMNKFLGIKRIEVNISQCLSCTTTIKVPENFDLENFDSELLKEYVKEQVILPSDNLVDDWCVDDFCVIYEK